MILSPYRAVSLPDHVETDAESQGLQLHIKCFTGKYLRDLRERFQVTFIVPEGLEFEGPYMQSPLRLSFDHFRKLINGLNIVKHRAFSDLQNPDSCPARI